MLRSFGIWFFGLSACALGGALIGHALLEGVAASGDTGFGILGGALVGLCAFSCARLWATASQRPPAHR